MPDALAKPLFERLLRSFPADRAYRPADWAEDKMPSPVRHYLEHVLRHQREREARRLRRARSAWVDYDHSAMEQAVRSFFETMEDHTQVPEAEWTDTLRTATQRTTAHLVRPVPLLTSFVFDERDDAVRLSEVRWRMRFFEPYGYLREAVEAFAKKQDRDAFEAGLFERVLRQVDQRMTADFDADRWLNLIDPLFEMGQRAFDDNRVPLSLLRMFFEEKDTDHVAQRLAAYQQKETTDAVSRSTLRRLIDGAAKHDPSGPDGQAEDPSPPFSETTFQFVPEAVPSEEAGSSTAETEASGPEPLWQQFQEGQTGRRSDAEESKAESPKPLWTRFQTQRSPDTAEEEPPGTSTSSAPVSSDEPLAQEYAEDLPLLEKEVLGTPHPPNRDVYIRKLFDGDASAYRSVLERLRDIENWSMASQIIARDVFRAHQVNIYSDPAVHFTDTVEATFRE